MDYPRPYYRRLNVYAFDPSLDTRLETAVVNRATISVPWELLAPGPVGEYLEVIDVDPASGCFYAPVDLDHPHLLAADGQEPSEGSPEFHQQMVYAVAMTTIRHFERALGRRALWAARERDAGDRTAGFVRRLRIYPHALRGANAYYSPAKVALLFGYFPAAAARPGTHLPHGIVFTCLSHDVVAHETTHALLDGMHRSLLEPSNPDVLAFHEAFADLVALFQHFSFPEVLRHQVARTRGDLSTESLLAQLAQQFGEATGRHGALRDALGEVNPETDRWEPRRPDPTALDRVFEPHARGSVLVAAVFDAFVAIYKSRTGDLLRIATGGAGVLPAGALHPDLVNRLADEAAKSARHVLSMCIRALDYCPPVDLTFGEYLRALVTADFDLVRDDDLGYRVAFIEAFRRRGIYPRDLRTLSVDSLRWQPPEQFFKTVQLAQFPGVLGLVREWDLGNDRADRAEIFRRVAGCRREIARWVARELTPETAQQFGLDPTLRGAAARAEGDAPRRGAYEVSAVRPARRVGPDGQVLTDVVVEITQQRLEPRVEGATGVDERESFVFRGGCTLIVDLQSEAIRYCIRKDVASTQRLERQREFLTRGAAPSLQATYFGRLEQDETGEPFAFLHSAMSAGEGGA